MDVDFVFFKDIIFSVEISKGKWSVVNLLVEVEDNFFW